MLFILNLKNYIPFLDDTLTLQISEIQRKSKRIDVLED